MARRAEHQEVLAKQNYDLVIVDEAHHLKNRATANWQLVNALNKRFLLLLSATRATNLYTSNIAVLLPTNGDHSSLLFNSSRNLAFSRRSRQ